MKKTFVAVALTLTLLTAATAQEVPTSNPTEVWVKGRKVDHSWRNGRIWVPTTELQPLLNMNSELPSMDLLKSLEEKGGYVWQVTNGKFEAKPDPSRYSQTANSDARARNAGVQQQAEMDKEINAQEAALAPGKLYYSVGEFVAETGFVRAFIKVTNDGPNPSDSTEMICHFTDGFGKPYAQDTATIPKLAPGESQVFEIFSLVKEEDTSIKPTKDNVTCYFKNLENPSLNPKTKLEERKQAKERKR